MPSRAAFSLLEVMVALALLAMVMTGLVSNMSMLSQARSFSADQEQANSAVGQLMEKLQAIDFDRLGEAGRWCEARFMTDADGDPLPGLDSQGLLAAGLISVPISLPEFEVFIEYYRGFDQVAGVTVAHVADRDGDGVVDAPPTTPGMMRRDGEPEADYRARVSQQVLDAPSPYRLLDRQAIQGVGLAPVVIRIVVRWADGSRRLQVFTTRRKAETV